jgi:hypothetical protein
MKQQFLLFFLTLILFSGCQFGGSETTKTGNLHVIDISKTHPKKEVLLQSIADIEYIPLETTDDILLSGVCQLAYFSDKYVVVWEPRLCNIFIFDRNGKIITHFNRKGPGNEEYSMMKNIIFDEENEEIFVFDNPNICRILVYSIAGEYKRTIKYSNDYLQLNAYNFDDDAFLVYDESGVLLGSYKEKPYMLMSKNDGSIVSTLDISLPVRYSNRIAIEVEVNGQTFFTPLTIVTPNNRYYGNNLLIADLSSDTIYLFTKNKELKPLIVRVPTVHSSEPRIVLTHQFATDKFIYLYKIPLDFEAEKNDQSVIITELMYEFTTGETSEISLVNEDYPSKAGWWEYPFMYADLPQNMSAMLIQMSRLKKAYEKKQLKGELEELVKTVDEEDNPILMIVKFK